MHFGNFTDIKGVSQEFSELIFTELLEVYGISISLNGYELIFFSS